MLKSFEKELISKLNNDLHKNTILCIRADDGEVYNSLCKGLSKCIKNCADADRKKEVTLKMGICSWTLKKDLWYDGKETYQLNLTFVRHDKRKKRNAFFGHALVVGVFWDADKRKKFLEWAINRFQEMGLDEVNNQGSCMEFEVGIFNDEDNLTKGY